MSERGYIRLRDADGNEIYNEFAVNSLETVRVTLTKEVDGTESALDVSGYSVRFYVSIPGSTAVVSTTMSNVTDGTNGKVTCDFKPLRANFATTPASVECAIVLVNAAVNDANTVSTKQETIWKGRWKARILGNLNEAS